MAATSSKSSGRRGLARVEQDPAPEIVKHACPQALKMYIQIRPLRCTVLSIAACQGWAIPRPTCAMCQLKS
eukprot:746065-Hanusia_phi.AAC.1